MTFTRRIYLPYLLALLFSVSLATCADAAPIDSGANGSTTPKPVNSAGFELSDAVKLTLRMQPSIQLQMESVAQAKGALRSATGDFDWRMENFLGYSQDYAPVVTSITIDKSDTLIAGVKLSRQFRSGIYVEPNVQYNQNVTTTKPEYLQGQPDLPVANSTRLNFLLRVPLMQGLGEKNTAYREIAAARGLEAARFSLLHQTSQAVLDTILAYFDYLGAVERLEIFRDSELRAKSILENTETLAKADELPAAEVTNVSANLADKESLRISAEQALLEAKTRLGLVVGIPYRQIEALAAPANSFPPLDGTRKFPAAADRGALRAQALGSRMDLLALRKQVDATEAQLVAARDQLRPLLNLELNLGIDGYKTGGGVQRSLQSFEDRQSAPDWSAGLRFVYPLGNNTSRGNLEQTLSRKNQGAIQVAELERVIQSNITLFSNTLQSSAAQLTKASEAVRTYQTAVGNEKEKYLMGEATLLDLLYIQDRLDSALLTRVSVLQQAAVSNARLRFEVGALLSFDEGEGQVDLTDLIQPGAGAK